MAKVICFIENLGAGGAERQMAMLAPALKSLGHEVSLLVYHEADHYRQDVEQSGVPIHLLSGRRGIRRAVAVAKYLDRQQPDIVIAYKVAPCFYAELASLFSRRYRLIVSERNHDYDGVDALTRCRFMFHRLADAVVCNSDAQREVLCSSAPGIALRTRFIMNCVDLQHFRPRAAAGASRGEVRIVVPARFAPQKNALRLVQALRRLHDRRRDLRVIVNWYGSRQNAEPLARSYRANVQAAIDRLGLSETFFLHDAVRDVTEVLADADAVCLPSLYEGCPNAVGEGMAAGMPILASCAGDIPKLVDDGANGFLFEALDVEQISIAIEKFGNLSLHERAAMGKRSRQLAEEKFSVERFANAYDQLVRSLSGEDCRLREQVVPQAA